MARLRCRYRCKGLILLLASLFLWSGTVNAFLGTNEKLLSRRRSFEIEVKRRGRSFASNCARRQAKCRGKILSKTALAGMWDQDDAIEGSDRIKACIPYLLPLIDGDQFGQYIYSRIPALGALNDITIGPLAEISRNIPFLTLGLFIALTLGTRFNTDMSRNLRFSAQQAALIDVALIFPMLIASAFEEDPLPQYIVEPCANFVWYAYMTAVIYSVYSNLRGKKPDQIPWLSSRADLMVGPF